MRTVPLALAAALSLAAPPLHAQDRSPPARAAARPKPAAAPAEKKSLPVSAGSDGFSLQNESGDFRLQLRGYAQFDGRFFSGDEGALADRHLPAAPRPADPAGHARPATSSSTSCPTSAEASPSPGRLAGLQALAEAPGARRASSRRPCGLERLQSATAINFVERAFPTALVPNRDLGIQLHGELAGGVVAYAAGIFDGAPDGGSVDTDLNDGKDLAGRVFLSPFKKGSSALKDLGLRDRRHHRQAVGPAARLPLRRARSA